MKIIDFTDIPLTEIIGDDEGVLEKAKELAKYLHIDIFTIPLKNLSFYNDYLRFFDLYGIKFKLPLFSEIYDFDLLIKLIVGSHSSDYSFISLKNNDVRVTINVSNDFKTVQKNLDELELLQVETLYKIYLNELIELELLQYDNNTDKEILAHRKKNNLYKFYKNKNNILKIKFYEILRKG